MNAVGHLGLSAEVYPEIWQNCMISIQTDGSYILDFWKGHVVVEFFFATPKMSHFRKETDLRVDC